MKKNKSFSLSFLGILLLGFIPAVGLCQINELNFNHQNFNGTALPRTNINPMSIKMWDNYGNGGPTTYSTILEVYGLSGHQTSQLSFGGWDNSKIRYREAFYAQNSWSDWVTLLDSKNNIESAGLLQISGTGNHYISQGNLGIGSTAPGAKLSFQDLTNNSVDGITWYSPNPLVYGIHRTSGDWISPNYQQLRLSWDTGLIIDPGTLYGKSYLDVQGNGIRVTSGSVGIGTTNTQGYKLAVAGNMIAEEVKVKLQGQWPDYVFEKDYPIKSLPALESFIKTNHHLPDVPSSSEVEKEGINIGEMNAILLKKIEELTLHLIDIKKENQEMKNEIAELKVLVQK